VRFNVKHGDFGVYYNQNSKYSCVLDCGSSQLNSCLHTGCSTPRRVIDSVTNRIPFFSSSINKRDILISHYHQDHFNGIRAFKKFGLPFFRNMFVPHIDFKANYSKQMLYSMCLLYTTSKFLKISFTPMKSFSSLFIEKYAKNYVKCHRGNIIKEIQNQNGIKAEVLWPPKFIYDEDSIELGEFIGKLEKALQENELTDAIEKTKKYLFEIEEQINSIEFGILDSNMRELDNQEWKKAFELNEIFCLKKHKEEKDDSHDIKDAFNDLRGAVKTFLNALSIVYRIDNKLVWMGDVTEKVLRILSQDLNGNYDYFKLPHHGTIDINCLNIKASKFIVSLSDGKRYHPINKENMKKALKDNSVILCTDGHRYCRKRSFQMTGGNYCSRNMAISLLI